jgi:AICAR transformylase/IMP cyclohydrolase PurH
MANRDKRHMIFPIKVLSDHGFEILATQGTAEVLRRNRVNATGRPQALRGHRARTASRPPCR